MRMRVDVPMHSVLIGQALRAIKRYFEVNEGRRITFAELRALRAEGDEALLELGRLCAEELGIELLSEEEKEVTEGK